MKKKLVLEVSLERAYSLQLKTHRANGAPCANGDITIILLVTL